jgi:hypothetical protein
MARLWTPTILILTLAAAGCGEASIPEATDQLPNAELSTQYIDYGEVDWGTTLSKDIVIKNSGKLAMGIGSITLGANEMEGNFTVNWSSLDLSCGEDVEDSDIEDSDERRTRATRADASAWTKSPTKTRT